MSSTFTTLGASNHAAHMRANHDYYATEPRCADDMLAYGFTGKVWECACGGGHLSRRLQKLGVDVRESDLIDRGIGAGVLDFLKETDQWDGDILTNPPFKLAKQFIEHSLHLVPQGRRVMMFLKLTFLEGIARQELFKQFPPKDILVYASRRKCAINGNFLAVGSSAACYAWFVWEKGFTGKPTIRWIK